VPGFMRVRLGTCNTYLIRGTGGNILVDAGNRNKEKVLFSHLKKNRIACDEILLHTPILIIQAASVPLRMLAAAPY